METKTIQVTEEDSLLGKQRDQMACPVALAIRRAFGNLPERSVSVSRYVIYVDGIRYAVPVAARERIKAFDESGVPMKPFEFELKQS